MDKDSIISQIKEKYISINGVLNERSRRIWSATEARALGYGGQILVAKATGIHKNTVLSGMREIEEARHICDLTRVRGLGGGRKANVQKDNSLQSDIANIVESSTRGDPESALLWSSKSTRKIAEQLNKKTLRASHSLVCTILNKMGFSLQGNRKVKEGSNHPDRDGQFNFINNKTHFIKNSANKAMTCTKSFFV